MGLKYLTKLNVMNRIFELLSLKVEMSLEFVEFSFITLENILTVKENRVTFLSNNFMKLTLKYLKGGTSSQTKCSICMILSRVDEEFSGNKTEPNKKSIDQIINLINTQKNEKVKHTAIFSLLIIVQRGKLQFEGYFFKQQKFFFFQQKKILIILVN